MPASAQGKPKVVVSRKLPQDVEERLAKLFDCQLNADDKLFTGDELAQLSQGADGLLVCPTDKLTAEVIGELPDSLKVIATFSVGYDHIDVKAAKARGLPVTNTPDVLTDATADIAMLLMLGAARGASWGERMVREKRWGAWAPTQPLGADVTGQRVGILGMGRIGRAFARRAAAFDMKIHYHNRSRPKEEPVPGAVYHATFEAMLPNCDFLSLHCASTPETRGIVNERTMALLPDGAILVNSARGDVVDDDSVIAALKSGKLAAAGLDVFKGEPNIDPRYRDLENVFLLPHLGSATRRTRSGMGHRAVDNLEAFFAGKTPGDLVTG
ncbi:MAG: 2-hydroxyacid dehydrogenase [Parvibaculaceae bacterium]